MERTAKTLSLEPMEGVTTHSLDLSGQSSTKVFYLISETGERLITEDDNPIIEE